MSYRFKPSARPMAALLGLVLLWSAACNLQEPAPVDGLGPDPAVDTLVITPQSVEVPLGDSIVFVAPDQTVEGTDVSGPVEWTVSGGAGASITTTGLFRATAPGDYTIKALRSGRTGRSRARVAGSTTPTLTSVRITPGSVTILPGATFTFAVSGVRSDNTTVPVSATWIATGGTVDAAGVYRAATATGQFRIIATQQGGSLADTAAVTISSAAPTLQAVEVTPAAVTLAPGAAQQFSSVGRMSDGSTSSVAVAWTATGGTVTSSGRYTAGGVTGSFRVIATQQGGTKADTSAVTITATAPTLQAVEVTPASVSLTAGAAQQFSAVGRMSDGSTSAVTVTWSAIGGTISGSGAFTAGSIAGAFRVIAIQQGGTRADTAAVTITAAAPTLQDVELSPTNVSLAPGASQQFAAIGRMSNGSTSSIAVTWSATGGTVSSAGAYTAGGTDGTFRVIARLQGGTRADTATVTIATPPPSVTLQAVQVSPASASLETGTSQQFSAIGRMSDGSTSSVTVTWSATGGTITGTGAYTAAGTPGSFRVIASEQGGTLADTSVVTVTAPPPTLQGITISPSSVSLTTGATQQFSAVGQMSDGSTASVSVTWAATGGTVSGSGLYTAGSTEGGFRVIATEQGDTRADTATVTITAPAPTLSAVEVTPASVNLVTGGTQQFSAVGRMSDGSTAGVSVTWSATGGTVNTAGLYTAGSTAGSFRVIATQPGGAKADTASVTLTVPAPTLTAVEVTPASVSLQGGVTQQFSVVGRMSDGSTTGVSVTWSATGGTVTSGGLYTAGATEGTFRVIATGGSLADTSAVTITVRTLTSLVVTPASVSLASSGTQQFAVAAAWSDGTTTLPTITWSATGGAITTGGLYTAGSTAGTAYRVIATGGGRADTSTVTVTTVAPTLSAVEVTPATASVTAGGTQAFSAVGRMSDNSTSAVTVTWSATGGTITAGGLYTAGSTVGTGYRVIAVQQGGTKADTSAVTVTAPVPPSSLPQPELPRSVVATGWALPTGGTTRTVNAGGDLQGALNAAAAGDVIVLQAGATFTGNFTLPSKSGSGWIYVMSAGSLPGVGTRVGPGNASQMAKLVTPNGQPALTVTGARWRVVGVEVTMTGSGEQYGLISLEGSQIILDRLYIHGASGSNVRRGVALNSASSAVIDSYISEIHALGADSQAICGWDGAGPFKIENNYLAGAGENLMFGGSDPGTGNLVPSDIEIVRNHLFKPMSWQGSAWTVKNSMELKNAQRLRIEGNIFENNWAAQQDGGMITFMGVNQGGSAPWSIVQDVTFRYNVVKNGPGGLRIIGQYDGNNPVGSRFLVAHNLFIIGQNGSLGAATHTLGVADGARDVTIENNTFHGARNLLAFWGGTGRMNALSYRNNVGAMGTYGIWGDALGGTAAAAVSAYFASATVSNNVIWGGAGSGYPAGNQFPASLSAVGFVNPSAGDYHLSGSSPYLTAGTNGARPGADIDQLATRTQGVAP